MHEQNCKKHCRKLFRVHEQNCKKPQLTAAEPEKIQTKKETVKFLGTSNVLNAFIYSVIHIEYNDRHARDALSYNYQVKEIRAKCKNSHSFYHL